MLMLHSTSGRHGGGGFLAAPTPARESRLATKLPPLSPDATSNLTPEEAYRSKLLGLLENESTAEHTIPEHIYSLALKVVDKKTALWSAQTKATETIEPLRFNLRREAKDVNSFSETMKELRVSIADLYVPEYAVAKPTTESGDIESILKTLKAAQVAIEEMTSTRMAIADKLDALNKTHRLAVALTEAKAAFNTALKDLEEAVDTHVLDEQCKRAEEREETQEGATSQAQSSAWEPSWKIPYQLTNAFDIGAKMANTTNKQSTNSDEMEDEDLPGGDNTAPIRPVFLTKQRQTSSSSRGKNRDLIQLQSDRDTVCCSACHRMIQDGAKYGTGKARFVCMDCPEGRNALCDDCGLLMVTVSQAIARERQELEKEKGSLSPVESSIGDQLEEAMDLAAELFDHFDHLMSTRPENDTNFFMVMDATNSATLPLSEQYRKLFQFWRDRPFLGFVGQPSPSCTSVVDVDADPHTFFAESYTHFTTPRHLVQPHVARSTEEWILNMSKEGLGAPHGVQWATFGQVYSCLHTLEEVLDDIPTKQMVSVVISEPPPRRNDGEGGAGTDDEDPFSFSQQPPAFTARHIGISTQTNALWYLAEMACIVSAKSNGASLVTPMFRRKHDHDDDEEPPIPNKNYCATGCYSKWPVSDILAAWHLAKCDAALVDHFMAVRILDYLHKQMEVIDTGKESPASFSLPPSTLTDLQTLVIMSWKESTTLNGTDGTIAGGSVASKTMLLANEQYQTVLEYFGLELRFVELDPFAGSNVVRKTFEADETRQQETTISDDTGALVIFTSGTSGGVPKGVVMTRSTWWKEIKDTKPIFPYVGVSAYSAAWSTDKSIFHTKIVAGGRIAFTGRGQHPFEVFRVVKPRSSMSLVPYLAAELEAEVNRAIERFGKLILEKEKEQDPAGTAKLSTSSPSILIRATTAASFFAHQHLLGGELLVVSVGGAAVRRSLFEFLDDILPCILTESYGITEGGGVLRDRKAASGSEVKLVDRPDLGYTTSDKPYPRGEIAVRSSDVVSRKQWLCDDAQRVDIESRYTNDGFLLTRDIGMLLPDGTYEVIDRATAVKKLPNGKFFSPERTEQVLFDALTTFTTTQKTTSSDLIPKSTNVTNVFVDVDGSTVVAFLRTEAQLDETTTLENNNTRCCKQERERLVAMIATACTDNGIPPDEIPAIAVFDDVEKVGWTQESGVLTASRKLVRRAVRQRMEKVLNTAACTKYITSQVHGTFGLSEGGETDVTTNINDGVKKNDDDLSAECLAMFLLPFIAPALSKAEVTVETVQSTFSSLGCDSLTLLRIPKVLPAALNRLHRFRGRQIAINMTVDRIAVPSLFRMTPLALAHDLLESILGGTDDEAADPEVEHPLSDAKPSMVMPEEKDLTETIKAKADDAVAIDAVDAMGMNKVPDNSPTTIRTPTTLKEMSDMEDRLHDKVSAIVESMLPAKTNVSPPALENRAMTGAVVLSGATGFLGKHLLRELVLQGFDAFVAAEGKKELLLTIICIGRGSTMKTASQRVQDALSDVLSLRDLQQFEMFTKVENPERNRAEGIANLFTSPIGFMGVRVHVMQGDLGCRLNLNDTLSSAGFVPMGLSLDEYQENLDACVEALPLADRPFNHNGEGDIDTEPHHQRVVPFAVIHNAAVVKTWTVKEGFDILAGPNIDGTLDMLTFVGDLVKVIHREEIQRCTAEAEQQAQRLGIDIGEGGDEDTAITEDVAPIMRQIFAEIEDEKKKQKTELADEDAETEASSAHTSESNGEEDDSFVPPPVPTSLYPKFIVVSTATVCNAPEVKRADDVNLGGVSPSALPMSSRNRLNAYGLTKLLSENLVRLWGCLSGVDVTVVRPPLITWSNVSGTGNEDDWINRLLSTCLEVRMIPKIVGREWSAAHTPVDVCAAQIIRNGASVHNPLVPRGFIHSNAAKNHLPHNGHQGEDWKAFDVLYPTTEEGEEDRLDFSEVLGCLQAAAANGVWRDSVVGGSKQRFNIDMAPVWAWTAALRRCTSSYVSPYHPLLNSGSLLSMSSSAGGALPPPPPTAEAHDAGVEVPSLHESVDEVVIPQWIIALNMFLKKKLTVLAQQN